MKNGAGDLFNSNIVYLIILIFFSYFMFLMIDSYSNGSAFYEDFYSKEISKIINGAEPGMEFEIDITPLAFAAFKNGKPIKEIISIDNLNNVIVVSSNIGSGTEFSFFNDVDVVEWNVESISGEYDKVRFRFRVVEVQR